MRKKTILLAGFVLMLGVLQANAQVTFGVKGGLNVATFIGEDVGDYYDMLPMLHIGGVVEKHFSEKFSIESGLLLSGKGAKNGEYDTRLGYLDIPINAIYRFGGGEKAKMYGFAGPYFGILLPYTEDFDFYNKADMGLNIGVGVEVKEKLRIGMQFGIGAANVESGEKYKNAVIGLSLTYMFKRNN